MPSRRFPSLDSAVRLAAEQQKRGDVRRIREIRIKPGRHSQPRRMVRVTTADLQITGAGASKTTLVLHPEDDAETQSSTSASPSSSGIRIEAPGVSLFGLRFTLGLNTVPTQTPAVEIVAASAEVHSCHFAQLTCAFGIRVSGPSASAAVTDCVAISNRVCGMAATDGGVLDIYGVETDITQNATGVSAVRGGAVRIHLPATHCSSNTNFAVDYRGNVFISGVPLTLEEAVLGVLGRRKNGGEAFFRWSAAEIVKHLPPAGFCNVDLERVQGIVDGMIQRQHLAVTDQGGDDFTLSATGKALLPLPNAPPITKLRGAHAKSRIINGVAQFRSSYFALMAQENSVLAKMLQVFYRAFRELRAVVLFGHGWLDVVWICIMLKWIGGGVSLTGDASAFVN